MMMYPLVLALALRIINTNTTELHKHLMNSFIPNMRVALTLY